MDFDIDFTPSLEIDQRLAANVDVILRFQNDKLKEHYDRYNLNNQTLSSLVALTTVVTLCSIPLLISYYSRFALSRTVLDYFTCIYIVALIIVSNSLAWIVYFRSKGMIRSTGGQLTVAYRKRIQIFQMWLVFSWVVAQSFRLLARVAVGPCAPGLSVSEEWNCNNTSSSGLLPSDSTIVLMILPIYFIVSVRGAHYAYTIMLWAFGVICMIVAAIYAEANNSVMTISLYGICSLIIIMEMRKISLVRFFTHLKLVEVLEEQAKAADEANALEMRSMIANVAHDLKTPLTSFLTGIEYIAEVVRDLKELGARLEASKSLTCSMAHNKLRECIQSMDACANNMLNTNAFMMMTINRCIDYTKISKGVKLLPKQETIGLMEALQLPLKCMQDIQHRISLTLEPLSSDICSHIITDRQWLQENILCLLSNAVKYSLQGAVIARVTKIHHMHPSFQTAATSRQTLESCSMRLTQSNSTSLHFSSLRPHRKIYCTERNDSEGVSEHDRKHFDVLRFEVEDSGIGLSEDAMANLFNPFKQAQRLAGGTGLGLFSLAKRIEALGGSCGVRARSDGQEGSIFWFEIPYRPDPLAARFNSAGPEFESNSTPTSPKPSNAPSYDFVECSPRADCVPSLELGGNNAVEQPAAAIQPMEILVVDDAPSILKMTTMMLRRHRHRVSTATNGAEAVKMVTERLNSCNRGYDAVLMDLQMPVMDGLEATRRLRALEKSHVRDFTDLPRLIIVGVSANSDSNTTEEAYHAGVDAFIAKPFSLDHFYDVHKTIMKRLQCAMESAHL